MTSDLGKLIDSWRQCAAMFHKHGVEQAAITIEVLVGELEAVLQAGDDRPLTLRAAAIESGYSADHLARLVRQGKLANVGRKFAPRVRCGDLPKRAQSNKDVASRGETEYDPTADARSLRERRLHRGGVHGTT
jgi:hypothetical protein